MTDPIKITVRTLLNGEAYWSQDLEVTAGHTINVNTDRALATLSDQCAKLTEFVELCSRKGGLMVSGNRLSMAANNVRGRGAVVVNAEEGNALEGGV